MPSIADLHCVGFTPNQAKIIANADGWTEADETWAYASTTTITVPSDATTKYTIGQRIRFKQTAGTYQYGRINAVSSTLLTVTMLPGSALANEAITDNWYSSALAPLGVPANISVGLIGKLLAADMNSTADQAFTLYANNTIITDIRAANASTNLTTAAGGIYTGAGKTGSTIVGAAQAYSSLRNANQQLALTLASVCSTYRVFGSPLTLYLSLTTPQGGAATANFYIFGYLLD